MEDLALLALSPDDHKRLEGMGFSTLQQIALLDPSLLGMGTAKGTSIIKRARNIIARKNIEAISVTEERVSVKVKEEITDPVIVSIKDVLDANEFNSLAKIEIGQIIFSRKSVSSRRFDVVLENARKWQRILSEQRRIELEKEGFTLNREDILEFAKKYRFDGFWENVFEDIKGNDVMKQAIAVSLFSSFEEPIHTLIIGEPGSSKTLARDIIAQNFTGITFIGANSTKAGLVCNLSSGTLGALAYSDRKIVLVDEFDKIPTADVQYCYELLSNQKCSVHSARIHQDVEAKFTLIAFANPRSRVFREHPIMNIGLDPTLMSRFALVVKTDPLSEDERKELFRKRFYSAPELAGLSSYYNQWIRLARLHKPLQKASPNKVEEYIEKLNKIVEVYSDTPLRRDLRMGDYCRRIPLSIARAEFSDVTNEVINKSLDIIEKTISQWE
jgi:DNA replicative helicase MCM subunit Mcm2 (Cdc46/Mcm family)